MCHVTSGELSKPFYVFCESLSCFTASGTSAVTLARSKAMTSGLTLAKSVNVSLLPYQTPAIKKKQPTHTKSLFQHTESFCLGYFSPFCIIIRHSVSFAVACKCLCIACLFLSGTKKKSTVKYSVEGPLTEAATCFI